MKQVLQNPFRILGLPVSATDRQITKRVMEAETYLEMGKPLRIDGEYLWLPKVERSLETILEAQRKLHRLEDRFYHAMFWFHPHDSVDQLALEVLQVGQIDKAISLWRKQPSVSNLINLYVLHFALSEARAEQGDDPFFQGLTFAGKAFNSTDMKAFHQRINFEKCDSEKIIQDIGTEAINRVAGGGGLTGISSRDIRQIFAAAAHFPMHGRIWMEDRFLDEYRNHIESAIKACRSFRSDYPEDAPDGAQELLEVAEPLLDRLKYILKEDDARLSVIFDQIGNEILQCSIDYHNFVMDQPEEEELPLDPSVRLIEIAANYSRGPILKGRIAENLPILVDHADNQKLRQKTERPISEIFKILGELPKLEGIEQHVVYQIPNTLEPVLNKIKIPLHQLRAAVGALDETYLEMSSLVVQYSISLLIEYGNDDLVLRVDSHGAMRKIVVIFDVLNAFDMDEKARERLSSNRRTVYGILGKMNQSVPQPHKNGSSCYIATCVYGDVMAPEVVALRKYRDERLRYLWFGRVFIASYYFVSPTLVKHLARLPRLHDPIRKVLDYIIQRWCMPQIYSRRDAV